MGSSQSHQDHHNPNGTIPNPLGPSQPQRDHPNSSEIIPIPPGPSQTHWDLPNPTEIIPTPVGLSRSHQDHLIPLGSSKSHWVLPNPQGSLKPTQDCPKAPRIPQSPGIPPILPQDAPILQDHPISPGPSKPPRNLPGSLRDPSPPIPPHKKMLQIIPMDPPKNVCPPLKGTQPHIPLQLPTWGCVSPPWGHEATGW